MRLPIIFIIFLVIIAVFADWYIIRDIKKYIPVQKRRIWKIAYLVSMFIGYGIILAIFCIPVRDEQSDIIPVMWLLYSFLSLYIPKLIYLVCSVVGKICGIFYRRFRRFNNSRKRNYGVYAGIFFAVVSFFYLWWGVLFTRNHIEVNQVTVSSAKLPASFSGYKIVQLSDIHVGTWGDNTGFVEELVEEVNSLKPDLIVFTGDIVNRRTEELRPFLNVLSKLKAKDGVYSVLGNHDYGDYIDWKTEEEHKKNNELLAQWEKDMGWHLLKNESVILKKGKDSIVLIGVENWGEPPFPAYGQLKSSYPGNKSKTGNLNDSKFKILLTHNPEHWNREVKKITNIDLSLSGHTHAMQMMLSIGGWHWSPSVFKYPNWGGLYKDKSRMGEPMYLYVNIGAGEVGMPSRLGSAYPEITEIILKK
ncbi:MAG: metallophosphoesterase [Muribaculaceae bacterium]|nr:metallophosphoesterase [Muribaculaceae bacterium]